MLKRLSHLFMLLFVIFSGDVLAGGPPILEWQKCFGGTAQDIPGSIIKTTDGSIIILGNVDSHNGDILSNSGSTDIWISKTDSVGNIIWKKSFGGSSIDVGTSVIELPNGQFIIAGYSSSTDGDFTGNKGNFDVIIICTDRNGNIVWKKNYGGTLVDLCYSMIYSADGNLVLGGASYSNDIDVTMNAGSQDSWILKVDVTGNIIWQKSSGGSGTDICYALAQDANGNIYAAGTTNSTDGNIAYLNGNNDVWVLKLSNSGSLIWNKTFGGTEYETAQCLLIDSQQRILIGGYTRSDNHDITANQGFGDCWFLQINSQGNLIYQNTFGGTGAENLYSMVQTDDGGYLLASGSTSDDFDIKNTNGYEDVWFLKLNNQFSPEWSKNYGGTGSDRPVKLIKYTNGGYLLAAYSFSNNGDVSGQHGIADIWIVDFGCKTPLASFTTSSASCLGDTLTILNTSVNSTASVWSINNVFYSNNTSINIPFVATGNYHIELNAAMCAAVSSSSVDIYVTNCALPTVNIQASSNSICANSQVTFSDTSTNATGWQWNFPGGTPSTSSSRNPVITYSQPGVYSVMLTASNSYGNQTAMKFNYINVYSLPAAPLISVNGSQFTSSFAQSYQWLFNNTPIPNSNTRQFNATAEGYYSVTVFNATGCSSTSQPVFFSLMDIQEKSVEKFSVYPNPTNGPIQINLPGSSSGYISIYDMNGKRIEQRTVSSSTQKITTTLSGYTAGTYQIVFTDINNHKTTQISIINY